MNGQSLYRMKVIARNPPPSFIDGVTQAKQDLRTRLWVSEFDRKGTEQDIDVFRERLLGRATIEVLSKTPITPPLGSTEEKTEVGIPSELQQLNRWLCWKKGATKPNGKFDKVPYYASGEIRHGTQGSVADVEQLVTYTKAVEAQKQHDFDGVGLAMLGDGYIALDFDHCIVDEQIAPWVMELAGDTYAEISPSGKGIRAFYRGEYSDYKSHQVGVEVFCNKMFVTVTGSRINDNDITDLPDIVKQKLDELRPKPKERTNDAISVRPLDAVTANLGGHDLTYSHENVERIKLGLNKRTKSAGWNGYEKWLDTMFAMRTLHSLAGWPEDEAWNLFDAWSKWVNEGEAHYDEAVNRKLWALPERQAGVLKTFASILEDAKPIAQAPLPPVNISGISATDLANKVFPPLNWIVDGVLPEGSYLLSARPKVGKSWLALQICLAVAWGDSLWGRQVKQGVAIYLALEENERRLQKRLGQLRVVWGTPNLLLHTNWKRSDQGGLDDLEKLIADKRPRLVVIDTLAKIRTPSGKSSNAYEGDYQALAPITSMANKYNCCIVIVTHNRKGKSEGDATEMVSGTLGQMGAVDGALIIDGNRGDATMKLTLVGRDIEEDGEFAITKLPNGGWDWLGKADEVFISNERRAIIDLLKLRGALKPKDISDALGKPSGTIRKLLFTMVASSQVTLVGGGCYAPL